MTTAPAQAPHFEPWERFLNLSHALDDVPYERAGDVLPAFTSASWAVIRHLAGAGTSALAYAAIERARVVIAAARRT